MLKGLFSTNELNCFEGYHDPAVNWNGWLCPCFTQEVTKDFLNWLSVCYGFDYTFTEHDQVFTLYEGDQVADRFVPVQIDGLTLYRLDGYTWEYYISAVEAV